MDGLREPQRENGVCSSARAGDERDPAELLAGVRRGDADAFEALAREHAPMLFRVAIRLCGRREDAEDLVQETLVRALPALRRFEGRARLATYLSRAMGNLWKNRLRAKKRSRLVDWFRGRRRDDDATDPLEAMPDPLPDAQEQLEQRDRHREVRDAMERLEPVRRWTLLLREVQDLSYEEIAAITGVPVGTVRSRLARARNDLRQILGGST